MIKDWAEELYDLVVSLRLAVEFPQDRLSLVNTLGAMETMRELVDKIYLDMHTKFEETEPTRGEGVE